jgi:hypothetical protein
MSKYFSENPRRRRAVTCWPGYHGFACVFRERVHTLGAVIMRLAWRATMVACVLALSNVAAFAQTLVYSSGNRYFSGNSYTSSPINGPWLAGISPPVWEACAFRPIKSGKLDHVRVDVGWQDGFNGIVLSVLEGNAYGPTTRGLVLDTMIKLQLPYVSGLSNVNKVASVAHPTILAGKTYWLVMSVVGLNTHVYWHSADLKSKNLCLWSTDGGQTWYYPGLFTPTTQQHFAIYIQ